MAEPLDDDEIERLHIQAAMDQAGMGMQEPEVLDAIEEFFDSCDDLAVILHRNLPFETILGGLGGAFSSWILLRYPEVREVFDPEEG